jgi:hypothetical protein
MRSRTPSLIWIPFVFSVGTISWGLLFAGLVLLAAVILAPAMRDVHDAEATRNDSQATLQLLEQKIQLQKDFTEAASNDPVLMERLASRQLNLNRKDQELLTLGTAPTRDEIAARAKTIWEGRGRPQGKDAEIWREAELELRTQAKDRSVRTLIAESLTSVAPAAPKPVNPLLTLTLNPAMRSMLILLGCITLVLSFFLGVKYQRD